MDTSAIDESDVGVAHIQPIQIQQAPPNDDIEVHPTADRDEQLLSAQQLTDIDLQSQLQNWNFHTVAIIIASLKCYDCNACY
jgi:hypothetical protein